MKRNQRVANKGRGDAKQSDTNKKRRYNDIKSDKRESKEHRHFTYQ